MDMQDCCITGTKITTITSFSVGAGMLAGKFVVGISYATAAAFGSAATIGFLATALFCDHYVSGKYQIPATIVSAFIVMSAAGIASTLALGVSLAPWQIAAITAINLSTWVLGLSCLSEASG